MNEDNKTNEELSLEQAFEQLDQIIARMQTADIPLEDAFALYKKGITLVELCNSKIEKVECDIKLIEETQGKE